MKFNFPLGKKSLRRRFSYAIVIVVLAIIFIFGTLAVVYSYDKTTARLNRQLGNVSETATASLRSAMWNYENETINEIINAIFKEEGVAYLCLIDDTGKIYGKEAPEFRDQGFTFFENSPRFRTKTSPIHRGGKQIGTVQLALSIDTFRRDLWMNVFGIIGLTVFIIAAILLSSFFIIEHYIFHPLKQLEGSVQAITKKGLDIEVDIGAEDEIGNLARAFNQMRKAIKDLVGDLEEAKKNLEIKVQQRTADLKQARIAAEKANKAKDRFLADVSHEIRTPMSNIVGFTELFKNTGLNDRQGHYLKRIDKAARDLRRIIDDILDHSKMASGELEITQEPFSLQDILDDVIDTFKAKAEKKHISFILQKESWVPNALVGDGLRLKQVLINLVHNALRFTEKGEIRLTVDETEIEEYSTRIRFEVSDTGCGIPPDKIEDVFEPYHQIDHPNKEELSKGIGLGLTISRQLVKLMGGELLLESKVEEGSRFYFEIAFKRALDHHVLPDRSTRDIEPEEDWSAIKGINVLVVEDDEPSRELMEIMLSGVGMTVVTEGNGNTAFQMIIDGNYDIVLMDLKIPGMNGYQLTQALRNMERFKNLPIIAVTAHAIIGERYECLKVGMNDYLSKPVDRDLLLSTIADYVVDAKEKSPIPVTKEEPKKSTITFTPEDKALIRILKGIDVETGLNRVKLDLPTYIKRLAAFAKTHAGIAGRIKEAIDRGDTQTARDLLHTLRGSAANHDAKTLTEVAAALHKAVKQGKQNLAPMVLELEHTLHQLTEAIRAAEKRIADIQPQTKTPTPPPTSRSEWEYKLTTLSVLLNKGAFKAKKYFLELLPHLKGNIHEQEINQLKDQIANSQFKMALDTLKTITNTLGISITEE